MDETERYRGKPLGQILKAMELVNEGHIQEALQIQRTQGGPIGAILVTLGYVVEEEVQLALAMQRDVPEPGSDLQLPAIS